MDSFRPIPFLPVCISGLGVVTLLIAQYPYAYSTSRTPFESVFCLPVNGCSLALVVGVKLCRCYVLY